MRVSEDRPLQRRGCEQPVVDARTDAEEGNACGAESQSHTGVDIGLERRQRIVRGLDIHSLDDEQIVVQAHNGVMIIM